MVLVSAVINIHKRLIIIAIDIGWRMIFLSYFPLIIILAKNSSISPMIIGSLGTVIDRPEPSISYLTDKGVSNTISSITESGLRKIYHATSIKKGSKSSQ